MSSIKNRLILMNFLQFFIWGSWLITIGAYWFQTKHWSGAEFGAIFSTMGIASLFMPAIAGIIADRWINAEKLYGALHVMGAVLMFMIPLVDDPSTLFLGIYGFSLPACPPLAKGHKKTWVDAMGLNAFSLFKQGKMVVFFLFAMLLGAALQLTNAYGDTFLHDFAKIDAYKDLLAVKFPAIIMSVSQISETLFILTIPFFLRRFGIKKVMIFSMIAWVLRFGLFAYGNPADGLWMIIASCIIYGMAFDFFNISGSIFVETQIDPRFRASAQGLFMMMANGLGAFLGSRISGIAIDRFFKTGDEFAWKEIWLSFAAYSFVVAILFMIVFRHKHNPKEIENFHH